MTTLSTLGMVLLLFIAQYDLLYSSTHTIFLPLIQNTRQPAFYVDTKGSDTNTGSIQSPWKTLQYAANTAPAGSIIYVRDGSYAGFTLSRPSLSFIGYPGETAEIAGNGARTSTVMIRNISGAEIRNLIFRDNLLQYGTGLHVENASNIVIDGNTFRGNQGFGLVLKDVSNVTISNNEATHNGGAIEVRYGSENVSIQGNRIFANDQIIDSGRAAVGITFYRTTGPVTAENNLLWENHTPGVTDMDGGAFEVYAGSNITIRGNVMWDNENVLETGTDSARTPCNNLTFTRNIAYRTYQQKGMILRCASNSLVAHNTFNGLDKFAFDISHNQGSYGGPADGLRIENNIVVNGRVYSINSALPASVMIDYNLVYNPGSTSEYGKYLAYVAGFGNTDSLAQFNSWTGYEINGLNADPLFVNAGANDYHLTASSPAIDNGVPLEPGGGSDLPDIGRFEYSP